MIRFASRFVLVSIFFILFFSPLLFNSSPLQAEFFLHPLRNPIQPISKRWDVELNTLYDTTGSNFNVYGSPYIPSGFQQYALLQEDLTVRVNVTDDLSLFGRLSWAYLTINSLIRAGRNFGFPDQMAGFVLRLAQTSDDRPYSSPVTLDFVARLDFPGYKNASDEALHIPYMGDGTLDVTGALFLSFPLWSNQNHFLRIEAGGGYTWRSLSFSSAFPYSFMVNYIHRKRGWGIEFGSTGFISARTDLYGTLLPPRSNDGTGGSMMSGASNPSLVHLTGRINYRFGPQFELFVGASQAIWGQLAPNGTLFYGGLGLHLGSEPAATLLAPGADLEDRPKTPHPEKRSSFADSTPEFINYSLEAKVVSASDRLSLVKINKGSQDGIEVGQIFDIYEVGKDGSEGEAVARTEVTHLKQNESALRILEYFKEVGIDEGFSAKRLIH